MTNAEFNTQYKPLEHLLYSFAMKLTKNKVRTQDLMQETLYRAFKNKDRFKEGTNFKAWITTILRNNFINDYRKRKTRNKIVAPIEDYGYFIENKSVDNNVGSIIMMKELNKMVKSLPENFQVPFVMFNEGYHYNEIASIINIPIGTVKSRIYFARKKLKAMVYNQYGNSLHRRA